MKSKLVINWLKIIDLKPLAIEQQITQVKVVKNNIKKTTKTIKIQTVSIKYSN